MLLANRYCYGTRVQRRALIANNIETTEDLLHAVRKDVDENLRYETNPKNAEAMCPVYKMSSTS